MGRASGVGVKVVEHDSGCGEICLKSLKRLNHVLITEASLRYNTCYIKWNPKSYRALFNTYTRSKLTTPSYRK